MSSKDELNVEEALDVYEDITFDGRGRVNTTGGDKVKTTKGRLRNPIINEKNSSYTDNIPANPSIEVGVIEISTGHFQAFFSLDVGEFRSRIIRPDYFYIIDEGDGEMYEYVLKLRNFLMEKFGVKGRNNAAEVWLSGNNPDLQHPDRKNSWV